MSVHPANPWTYEDYLDFPDDGKRYEIVDGEVHVTPAADTRHQDIVGWVFVRLYQHVDRHGGGRVFVAPYDVVLSDTDVVQPDVLFVAEAARTGSPRPTCRGHRPWPSRSCRIPTTTGCASAGSTLSSV